MILEKVKICNWQCTFIIVLSSMFFFISSLDAQNNQDKTEDFFRPFHQVKKSKVMIVGTFHFSDGGHDAFVPKFSVNINSETRQNELSELIELFSSFSPTIVAIESKPERQVFHDSLYREYLLDRYDLGQNEIYQVCYRLARKMGLQKLYTIDAPARTYESFENGDSIVKALCQENYIDTIYNKMYFDLYSTEDSLKSIWSLRKTFAYQNNPDRLELGLGHYLVGDFKAGVPGNYIGPDASTYWWNRNLRIFANILQLAAKSNHEHVFVLIGAGHLPILRFLAKACPEIEYIDAYDMLKQ